MRRIGKYVIMKLEEFMSCSGKVPLNPLFARNLIDKYRGNQFHANARTKFVNKHTKKSIYRRNLSLNHCLSCYQIQKSTLFQFSEVDHNESFK